jgi:hypothetical protein
MSGGGAGMAPRNTRLHRTPAAFLLLGMTTAALFVTMAIFWQRGSAIPSTHAQTLGSATIKVVAPSTAQPLNTDFTVNTRLDAFTPGADQPTWAGWNMKLRYDPTKLAVVSTASGGLCPGVFWFLNDEPPDLNGGCAFQTSTATGNMDTITFRCIADGVVPLHLVSVAEDSVAGTTLFDENAVNIPTTLVDAAVTCGTGGPTATPTNTFTPSPTPTATPTSTPTPTGTPPPTAVGCTTNVGGPPTLGTDDDCDTDLRFGGYWGDGCADSEDSDDDDPWGQIYTVPVPALLAAPNSLRDNVVKANDAQAVYAYVQAGATAGSAVYEQDLNGNRIKDGWEYDRSVVGPSQIGPPDGTVTPRDAQAAFAQFQAGVQCSSGYDMRAPLCLTNVGGPPTLGLDTDCDFQPAFPGILGDGCADSEDAHPSDPWRDLYSVPVPALLGDPSALRNNVVSPADAQAIFAYFVSGASVGDAIYEQDLNSNRVKDGWEYDRVVFGGGLLGPPDGVVTAQDAQASFAQWRTGTKCSSGYDMRNG